MNIAVNFVDEEVLPKNSGEGPLTAVIIIFRINDKNRFLSVKQLAALQG
jgi:hypothetical protein